MKFPYGICHAWGTSIYDGASTHKSAQPCAFLAQTFDTRIIGYGGQEVAEATGGVFDAGLKGCAAFRSRRESITCESPTSFLEEGTTTPYSGCELEPTRLQAEDHIPHTDWAASESVKREIITLHERLRGHTGIHEPQLKNH
ncbi:hypothetical protein TNCV_4762831 [Trichonephila clavipes]|nr:hypothetical protein TNCV_4762831 [Trichonephila clavipes]